MLALLIHLNKLGPLLLECSELWCYLELILFGFWSQHSCYFSCFPSIAWVSGINRHLILKENSSKVNLSLSTAPLYRESYTINASLETHGICHLFPDLLLICATNVACLCYLICCRFNTTWSWVQWSFLYFKCFGRFVQFCTILDSLTRNELACMFIDYTDDSLMTKQVIFFAWHVHCVCFNIRTEEWVSFSANKS